MKPEVGDKADLKWAIVINGLFLYIEGWQSSEGGVN